MMSYWKVAYRHWSGRCRRECIQAPGEAGCGNWNRSMNSAFPIADEYLLDLSDKRGLLFLGERLAQKTKAVILGRVHTLGRGTTVAQLIFGCDGCLCIHACCGFCSLESVVEDGRRVVFDADGLVDCPRGLG